MNFINELKKDVATLIVLLAGSFINLYFSFANNPSTDRMYGELSLILIPYLLYLFLMLLPKLMDKTDDFIRSRKFRILLFLFLNFFITIGILRGSYINAPEILAIVFSLFVCFFGKYLSNIKKSNEMWGFKTPWNNNNINLLYKTNQFGGRLLYFTGFVCIFLTYIIGSLLCVRIIVAELFVIYLYSFQISRKSNVK